MSVEEMCVLLRIVIWVERVILIGMLVWLPVSQIMTMSHEKSWGAWILMMLCLLWSDAGRRMILKKLKLN